MKSIIVSVSPEGEVEIKSVGFKGQACLLATKAIEKALGTSKKDIKAPEFFQSNQQTQKASQ